MKVGDRVKYKRFKKRPYPIGVSSGQLIVSRKIDHEIVYGTIDSFAVDGLRALVKHVETDKTYFHYIRINTLTPAPITTGMKVSFVWDGKGIHGVTGIQRYNHWYVYAVGHGIYQVEDNKLRIEEWST